MLIEVDRINGNYGGTNITTKYSPLEKPKLIAQNTKDYLALFAARTKLLTDLSKYPAKLELFCTNWPATPTTDAPPMIVISSGRPDFIAGLLKGEASADVLKAGKYSGYTDTNTYKKYDLKLWYSPKRSKRQLFIVVHKLEYMSYHKPLSVFPDVHVVGWQFPIREADSTLCGFGASRFAALEMAKDLGYSMAWLVDDNVGQINGFPASPKVIEDEMTERNACGIGFQATTHNMSEADVYTKSKFDFNAPDFDKEAPGLLQQAVLWNIKMMNDDKINFSPLFISSNEDSSFSNFLKSGDYYQRVLKGMSILKLDTPKPDKDADTPGNRLNKRKTLLLESIQAIEKGHLIQVALGGKDTLENFIPKQKVYRDSGTASATIESQLIEQIMSEAAGDEDYRPRNLFTPFGDGKSLVRRQGKTEAPPAPPVRQAAYAGR